MQSLSYFDFYVRFQDYEQNTFTAAGLDGETEFIFYYNNWNRKTTVAINLFVTKVTDFIKNIRWFFYFLIASFSTL